LPKSPLVSQRSQCSRKPHFLCAPLCLVFLTLIYIKTFQPNCSVLQLFLALPLLPPTKRCNTDPFFSLPPSCRLLCRRPPELSFPTASYAYTQFPFGSLLFLWPRCLFWGIFPHPPFNTIFSLHLRKRLLSSLV